MKLMNSLVMAATAALVLGISGCSTSDDSSDGDSGSGGTSGVLTLPAKVIATPQEAKNASAVGSSTDGLQGMSDGGSQSAMLSRSIQRAMSTKAPESETCTDGGTTVYDMNEVSGTGKIEFKNCKEDGATTNGTIIFEPKKIVVDISTVVSGNSESMTMKYTMIESISGVYTVSTIDGSMKGSDSKGSFELGYQALQVAEETAGEKFKIDGKISVKSEEDPCVNGGYTFKTLEPMVDDHQTGATSSGKVDVNGVKYTFYVDNSGNGKITVEFANGNTTTINQNEEVICN